MSPSPLRRGVLCSSLSEHTLCPPPNAECLCPQVPASTRCVSPPYVERLCPRICASTVPYVLPVLPPNTDGYAGGSSRDRYPYAARPFPYRGQPGHLSHLPGASLPYSDRKSQEIRERRRKVPQRRHSQARAAAASALPPGAARLPASQRPGARSARDSGVRDPARPSPALPSPAAAGSDGCGSESLLRRPRAGCPGPEQGQPGDEGLPLPPRARPVGSPCGSGN